MKKENWKEYLSMESSVNLRSPKANAMASKSMAPFLKEDDSSLDSKVRDNQ